MTKFILPALVVAIGLTTYFFFPPMDNARADEWSSSAYQDCIIENLKDMQADRAVTVLEEYCKHTSDGGSYRR